MSGHPALRDVGHRLSTSGSVHGQDCCYYCRHSYADQFLVGLYGCTNRKAVAYVKDKGREPLMPGQHTCNLFERKEDGHEEVPQDQQRVQTRPQHA